MNNFEYTEDDVIEMQELFQYINARLDIQEYNEHFLEIHIGKGSRSVVQFIHKDCSRLEFDHILKTLYAKVGIEPVRVLEMCSLKDLDED